MQKKQTNWLPVLIMVCLVTSMVIFSACSSDEDTTTPAPATFSAKYSGTVYVAGHGGHVAKASIKIDPDYTSAPIQIDGDLEKIGVRTPGTKGAEIHDVRLDSTTLFWSTYKLDANGKLHLGSVPTTDTSGLVGANVKDNTIDPAPRNGTGAGVAGPWYCASGQTTTNFMPINMGHEGYVTVVPKSNVLAAPVNVYLDNYISDLNYIFAHGNTNAAGTKLFLSINTATDATGDPKMSGLPATHKSNFWIFDTADIEAVTATGSLPAGKTVTTGSYSGGSHVTFRSTWTRDGSQIIIGAADRTIVLKASDLSEVHVTTSGLAGENHDAMPTEDGKYSILTMRTKPYTGADADHNDGEIQLYDMTTGKTIGKSVSVCNGCHNDKRSAVLCGLDGKIIKN